MKKSLVSRTRRFTYFQILYSASERWTRTLDQTQHGKTDWRRSNVHQNTELWTKFMVSQWNLSGISFPGFTTFAALQQSPSVTVKIERTTRKIHWTDYLHVDVQRHLMGILRQWKRMRIKCSARSSLCTKIWNRTMVISWSRFRKMWYSISEDSPQGEWDKIAERMLLEFAESGHPIFRATSPLSRGQLKSKGHGKLSIHFCADLETVETVFSHNCFCQSAQSLRSSLRYVWRMQSLPW